MNIGRAIKETRKKLNLSQEELSKKAGITQAALSGIENGNRPNKENLKKLSTALEVPESLLYVLGMEKGDIAAEKQLLYDQLYPVIQDLILKIAANDGPSEKK